MDEQATDGPPVALRVVGGGTPSDEQLAALVVALTPVGGGPDRPARPTGWRRAAMLEGVGGRPPSSPADLDVTARWG